MGNIESSCISYFEGLQTKMKKIMAEAEAIEEIDKLNEQHKNRRKSAERNLLSYLEEYKVIIKRQESGETYDDLSSELGISRSTLQYRMARVRNYLERESVSNKV